MVGGGRGWWGTKHDGLPTGVPGEEHRFQQAGREAEGCHRRTQKRGKDEKNIGGQNEGGGGAFGGREEDNLRLYPYWRGENTGRTNPPWRQKINLPYNQWRGTVPDISLCRMYPLRLT